MLSCLPLVKLSSKSTNSVTDVNPTRPRIFIYSLNYRISNYCCIKIVRFMLSCLPLVKLSSKSTNSVTDVNPTRPRRERSGQLGSCRPIVVIWLNGRDFFLEYQRNLKVETWRPAETKQKRACRINVRCAFWLEFFRWHREPPQRTFSFLSCCFFRAWCFVLR